MATIPAGIILIWTGTHAGIPSGWSRETALDDKYPKAWGAVAPNNIGGAASHTHTSPAHSHTMASHSHLVTTHGACNQFGDGPAGGTELQHGYHSHNNVPVAGVSGGDLSSVTSTYDTFANDPAYYKVIFIKSATPAVFPTSAVCLYSGSSIPTNYYECNGSNSTPDLRSRFLKGASTGANAGTTGGTTTNVHALTHTHTESAHSHSHRIEGYASNGGIRGPGGGGNRLEYPHTHTYTLNSNSAGSISGSVSLTTTETVEPAYKKLIALQKNASGILVKGIIGLWLGSTSSLPRGWVVCDGNNNTKDMRDKFLKIGASTAEINATGGSNTHTHSAQGHTHTGGNHTHSGNNTDNHSSQMTQRTEGGSESVTDDSNAYHQINTVGYSTVSWNATNTTANSSDNQPAYRTVAYIQLDKLTYGGSHLLNFL